MNMCLDNLYKLIEYQGHTSKVKVNVSLIVQATGAIIAQLVIKA